jgi:hypothetical protein
MVMRPILAAGANTGNTGRDFDAISAELTGRLLSIVRERFADAEVATPGLVAGPPLPGYRAAARVGIGGDELNVAIRAAAGGATHLLVPTIVEWKEMRTDDPIGAFVLPHNSVTIRFRLMRLQPPALVAAATFHHQARLTLNTKAARLVDEGFRRTLLQVLGAL